MDATRIHWDDNPLSVQECMDFWLERINAKDAPLNLEFVQAMVGFNHAHWMTGPVSRVADLFSHEACPFRDSKHAPFSRSEVQRRIKGQNLWVNDLALTQELAFEASEPIDGKWLVLRSGKRKSGDLWIVGIDEPS